MLPPSGRLSGSRLFAALAAAAGLAVSPGAATAAGQVPTSPETALRAIADRNVRFEAHAFLAAAAEGDVRLVGLFLDAGMPATARDQWGTTALLEAARGDHADVVELLLARGAKPGDAPGGEPPLAVAAESGSLDALAALLGAGADPDQAADPEKGAGGTPLQRACAAEEWDAARLLLEAGAGPSLAAPPLAPPLFLAAESGHAPTVTLLLVKGADPNARFPGTASSVRLPAWNGHVEVVRALLLAGADPRADRAAILKGRPGQPVKPEIRKLVLNPPKPRAAGKRPPG